MRHQGSTARDAAVEFGHLVHGNYWAAPSTFGSANTSHGCVSFADAKGAGNPNIPGAWFYNHSIIGDVVIVKNTGAKTVQPDNGVNGWNMSWASWKAGSAA